MPDLVKGLAYVEEDRITVIPIFKCFIYNVSKPMTLLGGLHVLSRISSRLCCIQRIFWNQYLQLFHYFYMLNSFVSIKR